MNSKENQYTQLGLNIAYYRKLKGINQSQLADVIGLSRTHVSNIEVRNMPTSTSLDKLFNIADALEIPVAKLLEMRD